MHPHVSSVVQYTCATRWPQRLDPASTCLQHGTIYMCNKMATETRPCIHMSPAWYNIHVQQDGHRDQTLHPHVSSMVQYTCTTRWPQRLDPASTCLQHGTIYMYNKMATETRHCIHMLGYSMAQYTCATRWPQRLDTASTCWATAWYNIHVQQDGHRD